MIKDLRVLFSTFPKGTTSRIVVYVIVQFAMSLLDLVGIAAVLPILQILSGADLGSGYLSTLYEAFGEPGRQPFVIYLCIAMMCAFLFKALATVASQWWSLGFVLGLQRNTTLKLLDRYLHESYIAHRQKDSGEIIRTVGGAAAAAHSQVLGGLMTLATGIMTICSVLVFLLVAVPVPALVSITYLGVMILIVTRALGGANRRAGVKSHRANWEVSSALIESILGFREIKMHQAEAYALGRYDRANVKAMEAARTGAFLGSLPKQVLELATLIGIALLLIAVAARDVPPEALLPTVGLIVAAIFKMLPTVIGMTATIGSIKMGAEGLRITANALAAARPGPPRLAIPPGRGPRALERGRLTATNIRFRYPDADHDVISGISFSVEPGSSLALCGPSGSGKTTLADIVLGLLTPDGAITYGGAIIHQDLAAWRKTVAYVPQDVHILDGSLRQNVAFGVPDESIDDVAVAECLDRAALGEWWRNLPTALETSVGERGKRISGGQRQRVGIARALYRRPSVLILDEATSALDNETENRITTAIRSLKGTVTTIVIAHRLSTVKDADQILYMESGSVVAGGSFADLIESTPAFARLVELGSLEVDTA